MRCGANEVHHAKPGLRNQRYGRLRRLQLFGPSRWSRHLPMPDALTPACHQFGAGNPVTAHAGCVVQQSQIGQWHGLLQMLQDARIASQDALWRHIVTAFGNALRHSAQKLTRIVDAHHQQHHRKACSSGFLDQSQLGRVRKHRLAHKRQTLHQTSRATRICPSSRLGRTGLWIGDVLQGSGLMQVCIHKLRPGRQQALDNGRVVQRGFARPVGAGQQIENGFQMRKLLMRP